MTDAQQLKRLYILLRWYDCVAARSPKIPEQDFKLAMELEREMHKLQEKMNAAVKKRRKK
jgi:hypothetical protein